MDTQRNLHSAGKKTLKFVGVKEGLKPTHQVLVLLNALKQTA